MRKMFKYFISLIFFSLFFHLNSSSDSSAQNQCRTIHHTDVDEEGTAFSNNQCLLICSIHGKLWPHNINEGLPCPGLLGTSKQCKNGQCVEREPPIQLGYIDVEMVSAQLSKQAMVFADVCIENSSNSQNLPIVDRTKCLSCETKVVESSLAPVWNQVCEGSNRFVWIVGSRLSFEVWEQITTSQHNFVGGASILVSEIVSSGENHKQISLPLERGNNSGKITVRVTWTQK